MSERDGGPACPTVMDITIDGSSVVSTKAVDGMSLRDYFAGQSIAVMSDILPSSVQDAARHLNMTETAVVARAAYQLADAMLKEREK